MSILQVIILSIVEGITEFLPISSTGHLIIASELLKLQQSEFVKSFEIAIQFGAILSVVAIYFRKFFDWELIKRLVAAFIPTAVIGLALYSFIKKYLLGNMTVVLWSLFVGGLAIILFEKWHKESETAMGDLRTMPYGKAVALGFCQAVAVIPGVSRSAATIVGGLAMGFKRQAIAEFSFLLAVPTMAAATGLDLLKSAYAFTGAEYLALGLGFVVSFAVAYGSIIFLLDYIRKHSFMAFGIYRIVLALVFGWVMFWR